MDPARGLIDDLPAGDQPPIHCPDCESPWNGLPSLTVGWLGQAALRRCSCCGARWLCTLESRRVVACSRCEVPFAEGPAREPGRCVACQDGERPLDAREAAAARAAEADLRLALTRRRTFLGSEAVTAYLQRLVREIAGALEGGPQDPDVVLLDDAGWSTLALPSGVVVLSRGTLGAVEDEAELVFVLGHELAHVAARDTGAPLVRFGLAAVARCKRGGEDEAWLSAAADLARLGCGDRRERAADARAFTALVRLGYDPGSATRWLSRLALAADAGTAACAETFLAHPPVRDRLRWIERLSLDSRVPAGTRVNREVLRKVIGRGASHHDLIRVLPFDELLRRERRAAERSFKIRSAAWTTVAIVVLATLLLLFGLL